MAGTSASTIELSASRASAPGATGPSGTPGVLMVVGAYYPEISGGGLQCRTLVQALKEHVRFTVLATTRDALLPPFEEIDGVPVYRVFVDPRSAVGKARALARLVRLYLGLRDRFEVVHLHGFSRKSIPLVWLARWTGKRTIYKMTSLGADDTTTVGRGWLATLILRKIDRVVSVSSELARQYHRAGLPSGRLSFIPNGVDVDRFHPVAPGERPRLRTRLGLRPEVPLTAFIGFFSRDKAPDLLVEAWCRVRREAAPPPSLLLIGSTDPGHVEVDPALVARVRERIRAEGAEGHVRFVEETHDVPSFLQASDIFVLPSFREGLPNALLEAMASGLPVIASDLPGITDVLVEPGLTGFLVPPGDLDALTAALRMLLGDPALRAQMGARARALVQEQFSINNVARLTLRLYEELLG